MARGIIGESKSDKAYNRMDKAMERSERGQQHREKGPVINPILLQLQAVFPDTWEDELKRMRAERYAQQIPAAGESEK